MLVMGKTIAVPVVTVNHSKVIRDAVSYTHLMLQVSKKEIPCCLLHLLLLHTAGAADCQQSSASAAA